MSDQPADQYVDAYQPVTSVTPPVPPVPLVPPVPPVSPAPPIPPMPPYPVAQPQLVAAPDFPTPVASEGEVTPPPAPMQSPSEPPLSTTPSTTPSATMSAAPSSSEVLDDQNIFFMLGAEDGTEEQKTQFLDELQQIIWEDFLENDTKLLLTSDEQAQLHQATGGEIGKPLAEQEVALELLEKLIPDLEELMLEKAIQLKGDLFRERVASLRELYANEPEKMARVEQANELMGQNQWFSAAQVLNQM